MRIALICVFAVTGFSACGGDGDDGDDAALGSSGKAPVIGISGNTTIPITTGGSGGSNGTGSGGSVYMLPDDFTPSDNGGWKLGEQVTDSGMTGSGGSSSDGCGAEILGIVRDFRAGDEDDGHPDFETFTGQGEQGIVENDLGADSKPVYVEEDHEFTTTKANFDQWFVNVDGVNEAYFVSFYLQPGQDDVLTFHSSDFFPLDGEGFGNQGNNHNFHFTTEVHTTFRYNGGETFEFTGDDDLWVFINKKLAIDLGGLHSEQSDRISLDDEANRLGLTRGSVYALDLFHAERHTNESNFRIDTNLYFVDCGIIVPEPVR